MTQTLHLMVGLPRSGKSTKARELGYPIVEPDAIRMVMHGTPWKPNMESLVWSHAHIMVESLFQAGHEDVIVDATNHTRRRRDEWTSSQWAIRLHVVDTPTEVCIQRAIDTRQGYRRGSLRIIFRPSNIPPKASPVGLLKVIK